MTGAMRHAGRRHRTDLRAGGDGAIRLGCAGAILLLVAGTAAAQDAAPADRYRVEALAIDEAVVLDGRFDEPAWQRAVPATDFVQREPTPGAAPSERTEIRVLYTDRVLYLGIRAFDRTPDAIIAREMQRDGGLFRDDSVAVLLDTFDDDRNAYFFETNAVGARTDALITDEGRDTNFEWDGVWDVSSRRVDDGWNAEMAIPFSTLRFDPQAAAWGFNVRRLIRHKNEEVFWAPIGLDAGLFRVSLYGALTGIVEVEPGLNLNVKPYVIGSAADVADPAPGVDGSTEDFDGGLDVKWGVARGLSLDLTVNTDFAETEVDEQRVNLTRFSLFFPEKREFFLENAGIFAFGPDAGGGAPLVQVFFSRRVGIDGGQEVPVDAGARLTGRVGSWSVGALGVRTASVRDDGGDGVPRNDWGAVRLKRNLGQRSSVGVIATGREGGDGSHNRVVGVDFDWKPRDELAIAGFFARSSDSDLRSGKDWAGGVQAEWSGPFWSWGAAYTEIGERFEPDAGFLLRRGVRRYAGELEYEPRPDLPGVRNLAFELEAEAITLRDGTTESSEISLEPFGIRFDSEERLTFFVDRSFERLFEPFEIVDGVVIPAGSYTFHAYGVRFGTNESRRFSVRGSVRAGGFFDGDRLRTDLTVETRPNRFLRSTTSWERNEIDLPGGSFTTNVFRERIGLALSPRLRADTFIQYNDLDENVGLNLRFNWIYKPGADLFVVFNQNWDAETFSRLDRRDRQVIVKFTYLYQR